MSPSSMRKNSPRLNPMPEHLVSPSGLRIRPRSIPFLFPELLKKTSPLPVYAFFTGVLTRKDLNPMRSCAEEMSREHSPTGPSSMPQDSMPTVSPGILAILPTQPSSPSRAFTWNMMRRFLKTDRSRPISTRCPISGNPFWEFTSPSRSMKPSRSALQPFPPSGGRTTAVFPDSRYLNFGRFLPGKRPCFYRTTSGFGIWPFMKS